MSIDRRMVYVVLCAAALTGCEHDMQAAMGLDSTWGEANRRTMAAQVVNPEPDYSWDEMETSAEHSSQAIERYRNDAVKEPRRVNTTSGSSSGESN